MNKLSVNEVAALLKTLPKGNRGDSEFLKAVEALEPGAGLTITADEWDRKTSIPGYFSGKCNRNGEKVVRCKKTTDGYLVVKL